MSADKKIQFYMDKNKLDKIKKEIPAESSEFLSGVNIFSPDCKVKPEDPLGPFICDPNIKLSTDELNILSRGPKFMIREDLSLEDYKVDVEKMVVKQKYNNCFKDLEDDPSNCSGVSASVQTPKQHTAVKVFSSEKYKESGGNGNLSNFESKWVETSSKMPYDIRSKTLDMGNMQATSYKYNKDLNLPSNESVELETAHESRRVELLRVFNCVANDPKYKNSGSE